MRVLITGAAGFICGYLVPELLEAGHDVIGVDNFSKYGRVAKSYDGHPRYRFVEGDAKDVALLGELARDCDQVVASAAMIGGISYFHEFAYDLLAENERILAATFDAAIAAHKARHPPAHRRDELVDGVRVGDRLPDAGGRPAHLAAARLDVWLPEARRRVLREGRLGAVPAAVHDRAPVQLRGHRRAARRARHRGDERQREARAVARRAGPRAEGAPGPGPAPHPRRGQPGPALHVRRRPRARHPPGDGVAEGDRQRLQPVDRRLDDGPRARRADLAQGARARRPAVPLRHRSARSSTTSSAACRTCARPERCWASRRRRRSTRCSTRSCRGSARSSRRAACERSGRGRRDGRDGRDGRRPPRRRPTSRSSCRSTTRARRSNRSCGRSRQRSPRPTSSSSYTTSTATRPSRWSPGSPARSPASAGCATTSGAVSSTR